MGEFSGQVYDSLVYQMYLYYKDVYKKEKSSFW